MPFRARWRVAQYFELWWWRKYLQNRAPDVYLAQKRHYWQRVLQAIATHPAPGARVLDAGCGPAGIFTVLTGQVVDAVDPLIAAYERTLPHFRPADYASYVRFHNTALETFEPPETRYDWVYCLNAINHVHDLDKCLDRLVALTRPGGTLVISVDAHRHRALQRLFAAIPGDVLHPHQYTLTDYAALLERRGVRLRAPILLKPGNVFEYWCLVGKVN